MVWVSVFEPKDALEISDSKIVFISFFSKCHSSSGVKAGNNCLLVEVLILDIASFPEVNSSDQG